VATVDIQTAGARVLEAGVVLEGPVVVRGTQVVAMVAVMDMVRVDLYAITMNRRDVISDR